MQIDDIKYIISIIVILLIIPGQFYYLRSIIRGETKPHLYSKIIVFIVMGLGFFIQFSNGGGLGAIPLGIGALAELMIIGLALKYGSSEITKFDTTILIMALICIPIYYQHTNEPYFALFLIIFIDVLGMIPTIRKTISAPNSENLTSWSISTVKFILSIFSMKNYNIFTVLYPLVIIITNLVLIYVIVYFGRKRRKLVEVRIR